MNISRPLRFQNLCVPYFGLLVIWGSEAYSSVALRATSLRMKGIGWKCKMSKLLCEGCHDPSLWIRSGTNLRSGVYTCSLREKVFDHELHSAGEGNLTALFCVLWIHSITFPVALWQDVSSEIAMGVWAQEQEKLIIYPFFWICIRPSSSPSYY